MNDALGYLIDFIKPLTSQAHYAPPQRWNIKEKKYGIHQRSSTRYA